MTFALFLDMKQWTLPFGAIIFFLIYSNTPCSPGASQQCCQHCNHHEPRDLPASKHEHGRCQGFNDCEQLLRRPADVLHPCSLHRRLLREALVHSAHLHPHWDTGMTYCTSSQNRYFVTLKKIFWKGKNLLVEETHFQLVSSVCLSCCEISQTTCTGIEISILSVFSFSLSYKIYITASHWIIEQKFNQYMHVPKNISHLIEIVPKKQ